MPIDADEFHEFRDAEEVESTACDLFLDHAEPLQEILAERLNALQRQAQHCGCPACTYTYLALWLGHERVVRLLGEREELERQGF